MTRPERRRQLGPGLGSLGPLAEARELILLLRLIRGAATATLQHTLPRVMRPRVRRG